MAFAANYDQVIRALESRLGDLIDQGEDFDLERTGDVLHIEFEDGEKYVITPQAPTGQLWMSANYAGHRFNWSDSEHAWLNEKDGAPLLGMLAELMSTKLGSVISLTD